MSSFNPGRAEVPLALPDGRTLKLVMDYQAIGALIAKFGEQWDTEISAALGSYDCQKVCAALEILAAKHHPEMLAADFMAASAPWMQIVAAVNAAQNVFLFGHVGPQIAEDLEKDDEEEDGEGRPLAATNGHAGAKSSERQWRRLFRRVYAHRSSGP